LDESEVNLYQYHNDPDSLYGDMRVVLSQKFFESYDGADYKEISHTYEEIEKSPRLAFWFVLRMIKQPFKELESIISKDAKFAYMYAHEVLKGEFPEGEEAIASSAMESYYYASVVLDKRFEKGEANLMKDRSVIWRRHYCNRFEKELDSCYF